MATPLSDRALLRMLHVSSPVTWKTSDVMAAINSSGALVPEVNDTLRTLLGLVVLQGRVDVLSAVLEVGCGLS